MKEIDVVG